MTEHNSTENSKSNAAKREEAILSFWQENNIFKQSLDKRSPKGEFIFYEGPPTANGRPGIHHVEARAFKDIIPRYKTMRGYHVRRKGGWDTHGLPVELEVEKQLGLKSKKEIEEYGIAAFNEKCKESVWKYVDEWQEFTHRIGYWIDQEDPYITYQTNYIESLWHVLSRVAKKKLLYKDYKVVPWCPRCGTALSSHELAQGYKDVKDTSVYVKFKVKNPQQYGLPENTYLLAWTTTPWTLPGNVALAVRDEVEYVAVRNDENSDEVYILAQEILNKNDSLKFSNFFNFQELIHTFKGSDLVGLEYEPLYDFFPDNRESDWKSAREKAWKVYSADFVNTEDGTGVVHTAVMYGQDDFELGTALGLPKYHLVDETGKFIEDTGFLEGKNVVEEETAIAIIKDLAHRDLLFDKEKHEHSYPFCWRCKTRLIYYARDSWYIAMSRLKKKLIKENEKINWEPEHIKHGRFGEWLKDLKDWAISRNRYWGTPLPIWQCEDCNNIHVVKSIQDLCRRTKKSQNTYFVMRHGESESNVKNQVNYKVDEQDSLTKVGLQQVHDAIKKIHKDDVDFIITSPLQRTRETAEIVRNHLELAEDKFVVDDRLVEFQVGNFQGKTWAEYHAAYSPEEQFSVAPEGGETRWDIQKRAGDFLYELEQRYQNKKILVVTHAGVDRALVSVTRGATKNEATQLLLEYVLPNAGIQKLDFVPLPHNAAYELDLHRPHIDEIVLACSCGGDMVRVSEVMDVWFDSGAMPFAQDHYPFENKRWVNRKGYPADYISEAIDQTRGWFYTLHAVGILMKRKRAYKNVICLGHLLDAEGKKMSKSVGNVVNPWEMIEKYGVDALRYWMYTVNQPGESKNFDERTVEEIVKKLLNILENVVRFYELYAPEGIEARNDSSHVLDRWICARLHTLTAQSTTSLDQFKILEPARAIREFVNDLSTWYIRRSRDRFKGDDDTDKQQALQTTRHVLIELAKLMAPFTPFIAEDIYRRVGGAKESVHLEDWPKANKVDTDVLKEMEEVRRIVSLALESRATAGIKVRQPLARLKIRKTTIDIEHSAQLLELITDEVNVKEVVFEDSVGWEVELDTELTPELQTEGHLRDLIRGIQNLRKEANLTPQDKVTLVVGTDEAGKALVSRFENDIKKATLLNSIDYGAVSDGKEITIDDLTFNLAIKK